LPTEYSKNWKVNNRNDGPKEECRFLGRVFSRFRTGFGKVFSSAIGFRRSIWPCFFHDLDVNVFQVFDQVGYCAAKRIDLENAGMTAPFRKRRRSLMPWSG
jgi:hypothetical protein